MVVHVDFVLDFGELMPVHGHHIISTRVDALNLFVISLTHVFLLTVIFNLLAQFLASILVASLNSCDFHYARNFRVPPQSVDVEMKADLHILTLYSHLQTTFGDLTGSDFEVVRLASLHALTPFEDILSEISMQSFALDHFLNLHEKQGRLEKLHMNGLNHFLGGNIDVF